MDSWVLAVVVVVVVVVKRGSGPESGIGSTRSFFGVHLGCFCVYFNSSGNIVSKKPYQRKVIHRTPRLFVIVLENVNSGGGFLGFFLLLL